MSLKVRIYDGKKLIKAIDGDEYENQYEVLDDLEDWIIDMRKVEGYDAE